MEMFSEWFKGLCVYCNSASARTWDHIVPVSKGGETAPGNIVPACRSCNSRKSDMDVFDFIEKYRIAVSNALEDALALALEAGWL